MVKKLNNFRDQASQLRVAPPPNAWHKIDARLQVEQAGRKFRRANILSYAASVVMIIAALTATYHIISDQGFDSNSSYTESIRPIYIEDGASYGIFDIDRAKHLSLLMYRGID